MTWQGHLALMAAMFTIPSLQKLLVLGLVLAAVWYGFKLVGRIKELFAELEP